MNALARLGWQLFPAHPIVRAWVEHAGPAATQALQDPALNHWYQCENTWFVGVDALPNDSDGRINNGPALTDMPWSDLVADLPLHRGQLSVIWQGYPKARASESDAAFRYRQTRFGAHVDGLLPIGPKRQRMLREPHGYILGVPLNVTPAKAAPLIVWEGSHHIMRAAFETALMPYAAEQWSQIDITDAYHNARRQVFESCNARSLHAQPGEVILLHRHILHGMGAWDSTTPAQSDGRQIAYFRPEVMDMSDWLHAP